MTDTTTPKQRYEARKKLRREARDESDWKTDEQLSQEYAFDLADRFVSAFEKIAQRYGSKV